MLEELDRDDWTGNMTYKPMDVKMKMICDLDCLNVAYT